MSTSEEAVDPVPPTETEVEEPATEEDIAPEDSTVEKQEEDPQEMESAIPAQSELKNETGQEVKMDLDDPAAQTVEEKESNDNEDTAEKEVEEDASPVPNPGSTEAPAALEDGGNEANAPIENYESDKDPESEAVDNASNPVQPKTEAAPENKVAADPEKPDGTTELEERKQEQTAQVDESTVSKELPYSTRGRSSDKETSLTNSGAENYTAGETLEDSVRIKDASPASLGVSFLESLGEEERRTRTRFLPDVDGIHSLRKHEIKDDINLARSLVSSAGLTSLKKSKGKRADSMDVDEEERTSTSEDGSSEIGRPGTKTVEFDTRDLIIPSNAFVAPSSGASADEEGQSTSTSNLKAQNGVQSPLVVEAVTAFDPPRPPESIGAKMKHRMLRWERRPEDVEVDLNNYRKTVQRTREELQKAEAEYGRLETIDAHLRQNFLSHLNLMNEEYTRLNEEIGNVQQECIKAADLLTSRTRSRGAGKGSYAMRDVITVLKTKGAENVESMETEGTPLIPKSCTTAGIGGLAASIFSDWNRKTRIKRREPASSWVVPNEKVKTPYGEGVVLEVLGPEYSTPFSEDDAGEENGDTVHPKGTVGNTYASKEASHGGGPEEDDCKYLYPRVMVQLPYGVGYFGLQAIQPIENPCLFSDAKLANRWQNLMKTALVVGGTIDLDGMNQSSKEKGHEGEGIEVIAKDESSEMDIDEGSAHADAGKTETTPRPADEDDDYDLLMPFGSGLLPTSTGRGSLLQNIAIGDLEKAMEKALYDGHGVLGKKTNMGITEEFRKWEDEEEEYVVLQGSVLQLRNALVRQKRIRLLNERTDAATADRYSRASELVAEMRSDLKSLKHRLGEELKELGMDESVSEQILTNFYLGQDAPVDLGEGSPLKRSRRSMTAMHDEGNLASDNQEDDRESVRDMRNDDLSGNDSEAPRPAKKVRPNQ